MNRIRAGVVGVGHLGYHHARIYAAMQNVNLVGVADTADACRKKAGGDFDVPAFSSVDDLIAEGVDCASVAVPTSMHHDVTLRLLDAGVDTLVEKPIAASIAEAEAIVARARKTERLLQVGHIERFNGAVIALLEAIKHPRFIECHRLSPYPNRNHDVSVVHDLMIHDLEILLALDKSGVASIDAIGVPVFSPTEDIGNVRLRFASGCVANVTASRVSVEKMRKIRIFEEDAYISTDYSEQDVLLYRKKPGELDPGQNPMELIEIDSLPITKEEPLRRELESFVNCVRTRNQPVVTGEEGLAALRLAQDIVAKMREHPERQNQE